MFVTRLDHEGVRARLAAAGCVAAGAEADDLRRAAPDDETLESWVQRREVGEPLAWITGFTEFGGQRLVIDPGVYVPRWQSEELARRAAHLLPRAGGRVLDLCTGAGAIAAYLTRTVPAAVVIGTDVDVASVRCAQRNGVVAVVADLAAPFRSASFDIVTAVAPYVPTASIDLLPSDVQAFEPQVALDGGADGLDIVRRAAVAASRLLRPDGWFLVEIGGDQADLVHGTLVDLEFVRIQRWHDDEGDLRGVAAQTTQILT